MSIKITTAMILAAGLGLRMRPLTASRPKALVEVGGQALIDRILDRLSHAGVTRVVINLHYRGDMLRAHLAKRADMEIIFSDESDLLLDTGGGLKHASSLFGDEPIFTHNCDTLWLESKKPALQNLCDTFDLKSMDILMLLAPRAQASGYDGKGDFHLNEDGRLKWRDAKETAPFVWTGVQIFNPALLEDMSEGPFSATRLFDKALNAGRLFGVKLDGTWMHIGDLQGLKEAEILLKNGLT